MTLSRDTLLRFFEQVRGQLIEAGIRELAGRWDIREENEAGLLGYCHSTQVDEWAAIDDETKLAKFVVDYIGMRLIPDDNAQACRDDARSLESSPFSISPAMSSSSSSSSASSLPAYLSSFPCTCSASSSRSYKSNPSHSSSSFAASSSPVCTCSPGYTAQAVFSMVPQASLLPESRGSTEEAGEGATYYPLETLLPTLLHEFAHVLAPPCLRLKTVTGKRGRKWVVESHGSDFYQAFARILRVAEELNIFALPNTPNKLSMKALSRFDRIDLEAFALSPKSVLPKSYALLSSEQTDPNVGAMEAAPLKPIRLVISASIRGKPVSKPVIIDQAMSWQDFLLLAKDKLRLARLPSSVRDKQGTVIDETTFRHLKQDQTLIFAGKQGM